MLDKHNLDQKSDKLVKMILSICANKLIYHYTERRGNKPK